MKFIASTAMALTFMAACSAADPDAVSETQKALDAPEAVEETTPSSPVASELDTPLEETDDPSGPVEDENDGVNEAAWQVGGGNCWAQYSWCIKVCNNMRNPNTRLHCIFACIRQYQRC